jgi:hypothetical protein
MVSKWFLKLSPNHEDLFRSVKIYGMNKVIKAPEVSGAFLLTVHTAGGYGDTIQCGIISSRRCTMNGKYQPGQKVNLTGGNKNPIKEATVLKYTGGFVRPLQ